MTQKADGRNDHDVDISSVSKHQKKASFSERSTSPIESKQVLKSSGPQARKKKRKKKAGDEDEI
jgi:hypothetical protein